MTDSHATAPVVFAPEAHLPRERRLVVDGTAVTIETRLGVRHILLWAACRAVMVWSDRAEILLDDEVSVVIRAADWHLGTQALDAIRTRAPVAILILLPDDPEPEPARYILQGLATVSSAVLILLALSLALVAAIGIGVGAQDHNLPGTLIGIGFAVAALGVLRGLVLRLNVPRRWREQAAVSGRTAVALDSRLARTSDRALAMVEPGLYGLAGLAIGFFAATRTFNPLAPMLVVGLALAVRRERARRTRRSAVSQGHG